MSTLAPVALFVYNRPEHTRKTVEALRANTLSPQTPLYVFSDAARDPQSIENVTKVRGYVANLSGFASVSVIFRESNLGLAQSIIDGVSRLCDEYGRVIVLEDDLLTSPHFLTFMNDALNIYKDDDRVLSICGYMYPVEFDGAPETLFLTPPHSWGWATWKRSWTLFERDGKTLLRSIVDRGLAQDFDSNGPHSYMKMLKNQIRGRNDSWFVRWYASAFLNRKLSLYPGRSLVRNIGIDGTGVHCADWKTDPYSVQLADSPVSVVRGVPIENEANQAVLAKYFIKIKIIRYVNFLHRMLAIFKQKTVA